MTGIWQIACIWLGFLLALAITSVLQRSQPKRTFVKRHASSTWIAHIPQISLSIAIALFCLAYGWLAITRHFRFNSTGYDLAINEQILWNTINGRFFASSLEVNNSFADHFRPLLLLLTPIYALFQTPVTLLIIQTGVLAAGAIPLYLLAKHKLKDTAAALALTFAYLLYPALGFTARFDFHIEVFAIPAFLAAFYAMEIDQWRWASVWLIVPLLCKESMGISVAMFGLYALVRYRRVKWGGSWLLIGLLTFGVTSFWLLPSVRGEALDSLARYQWLGATPSEIAYALLSNPASVWQHIMTPQKVDYLLRLSLPVGFLNLVGLPELLLAAPALGINLLADHFCQSTIYCHYTIPIIPFIFVAAVFGLSRLKNLLGEAKIWRIMALMLVLMSFSSLMRDNPFGEQAILPSALVEIENADVVRMALAAVPDGVPVVTTNDYAPHLAQRQALYIIGIPSQRDAPVNPDVVFLNLYDQQYIVCDQYRAYVSQLDPARYGVTFRTGGLIVIQRDTGDNVQFQDFVQQWNNCAG